MKFPCMLHRKIVELVRGDCLSGYICPIAEMERPECQMCNQMHGYLLTQNQPSLKIEAVAKWLNREISLEKLAEELDYNFYEFVERWPVFRVHFNYKQLAFEDLIWAAGFFDGEGHIDITTDKRNPYGYLVVSITQNKAHLDILDLFNIWGGRVFPANKIGGWRWQAYANQACGFLKSVLPYLKLKRQAAKLGIEFQGAIHNRSRKGRLTQEERQKREALIKEFREIQPARRNKAFLKFR